jgi:hypothetical protein
VTAVVRRSVDAPAVDVYAVLADGWSYAAWVVGASRVREVDGHWPAEGSRIHHSVGVWPLVVNDATTVISSVGERSVELDVGIWFLGRGRVSLRIEPDGAQRCTVVMSEWMTQGPISKIPDVVVDPLLHQRNIESLRRLAAIAEGRGAATATDREDH